MSACHASDTTAAAGAQAAHHALLTQAHGGTTHRTTTVLLLAAALAAGATACSSSDTAKPAPTVTVTETVTAPPEADTGDATTPADEAASDFKVGEEASNGGATVKISKFHEASTITLDGATKQAGVGAKYVILDSVVTNDTKASMDLTCGLPIVNALIDIQGRRFDTIEDLYEVAGNPECNAELQPGFKDEMAWVYRVPKDATPMQWEFSEYDLSSEPTPSVVVLT